MKRLLIAAALVFGVAGTGTAQESMPNPYLNYDAAVLNASEGIERDSGASFSRMNAVTRMEQREVGKPMPGVDFTTTSSITNLQSATANVPATASSVGTSDWDVHSGR